MTAMAAPTQRQRDYLAALIKQAGVTPEEWQESVGLIEANAWGGRLRTEMITRANMSRWIGDLKSKVAPVS